MLGIVLLMETMSACAQEFDLQRDYFNGLRTRGLFVIAEDYAVSRLNSPDLLPADRARMTVELAQTLVQHATQSTPSQRDELWQEAERLLMNFIESNPQNPRLMEVQVELGLLPSMIGEFHAWNVRVNPQNQAAIRQAIGQYEAAIPKLNQTISLIHSTSPQTTSTQVADGALEKSELSLLTQQLQFHIAQAKFFLAKHDASGANKAGFLIEVQDLLNQLSKDRDRSIWTMKAKLQLARLASYQGESKRAESILNSLKMNSDEFGMTNEVFAELARVHIENNEIDKGLELLFSAIPSQPLAADELRAVAVEGLLAARKIALQKNDQKLAEDVLTEAKSQHQLTHGKWHQLTAARLQQVERSMNLGDELATLVSQAESAFQSGNLKTAVENYRKAAAAANRDQKQNLAVQYAFTAGSIEIQQQHWSDAVEVFHEIVQQFPGHEQASQAALMKSYALGQSYVQTPSSENRNRYEEALNFIVEKYPETTSAVEAAWMLGVYQEQRLQWTTAIDHYQKIPATHARYDTAMLRVMILYQRILDRLREINGPVNAWEDRLIQEIVEIEDQFPAGNVLRSIEQCQTSLLVAQLLLQHRDRWYRVADQWLERVHKTVDYQRTEASVEQQPLDSKWLQMERTAAQMRIVSLAGQQKLQQAREILLELQQTDPTTMLGILLGLTEMVSRIDDRHQAELGYLQLEAIEKLLASRDELTTQQRTLLEGAHAEAFIAIGNLYEAAEIYENLIDQSPQDQQLIRKVIQVLMKRGKAEDLVRAQKWWTRLEQLNRPGTNVWLEARLEIARLNHRLGESDRARKLLGVTQALYPKLGNKTLAKQYADFLNELN